MKNPGGSSCNRNPSIQIQVLYPASYPGDRKSARVVSCIMQDRGWLRQELLTHLSIVSLGEVLDPRNVCRKEYDVLC